MRATQAVVEGPTPEFLARKAEAERKRQHVFAQRKTRATAKKPTAKS